ncbi:MAG: DUF898 family protein, partial [Alphaproteobacteria bacterium]|nr:DUF898 family protein [Alphaproteobacteria bacterium]
EYKPAGSLARLLVKNGLKSLITLYIYRFWAKTAVRRYFWQAIRLDGDPFEYTGLGRELLIGFLIVVAILAPIVIAWNAVRAALRTDPLALGLAQAAYFFVLYSLVVAAGFRARRYRLSRTRWRGIRAGQDGSTWRYLGLAIAWGLATLLTLGFATPWMRTALQRYRTEHTLFGDQRFAFDASALPLLPKWLIVLAAGAAPIIIAGLLAMPAIRDLIAAYGRGPAAVQAVMPRAIGLVFVPYLALLTGGIAYAGYRAAEFRHFAAGTRLGSVHFTSAARGGAILGRVLLCLLADFGCLLLFGVMIGGLVAVFGVFVKSAGPGPGLSPALTAEIIVVGIVGALILLFAFRFLWTLIVTAPVLRHFCQTLEVFGVETLGQVAQSVATRPKYGEGLADSFDFGAM